MSSQDLSPVQRVNLYKKTIADKFPQIEINTLPCPNDNSELMPRSATGDDLELYCLSCEYVNSPGALFLDSLDKIRNLYSDSS